MRKDYDSLMATSNKQTYDLRNMNENTKKNSTELLKMHEYIEQTFSNIGNKQIQGESWTQKQMMEGTIRNI